MLNYKKMNNKKTILQIIPSLDSGGVERGVLDINYYLVKNGFNSIVLSSGGNLVSKIKENGGTFIQLKSINSKNPIQIYRNIKKIKDIIIQNKVDLVHVRSRAPAWSAYFACKKLNCQLVSTIHGNYGLKFFPFHFLKKLYNSSMCKADWIICVSNYIKDYAYNNYLEFKKKFIENKVRIIHRGVDTNIFNPDNVTRERIIYMISKMNIPNDIQIILLPGRFTEWKGQLYFLDVLKNVKNKNYLCIMIGDTKKHKKYVEKIKNKIKKLKLENNVRIEDNVFDITTLYFLSTIVVSSSLKGEPFGRIIPEGQAMKKIVISTSSGGSLETIIDKKTGWLVKKENIKEFANLIDIFLSMSNKEKKEIGELAREHILNNFTTESMCLKTIDFYKEILNIN